MKRNEIIRTCPKNTFFLVFPLFVLQREPTNLLKENYNEITLSKFWRPYLKGDILTLVFQGFHVNQNKLLTRVEKRLYSDNGFCSRVQIYKKHKK